MKTGRNKKVDMDKSKACGVEPVGYPVNLVFCRESRGHPGQVFRRIAPEKYLLGLPLIKLPSGSNHLSCAAIIPL
jgi:hypothetical protein